MTIVEVIIIQKYALVRAGGICKIKRLIEQLSWHTRRTVKLGNLGGHRMMVVPAANAGSDVRNNMQ